MDPGIHTISGVSTPASSLGGSLAYNSDVAAGQLVVFQGASEVPVSELIRVERATRKNSQLAAAQRVALKMGGSGCVARRFLSGRDFHPTSLKADSDSAGHAIGIVVLPAKLSVVVEIGSDSRR
jgi:hypothetical protein